MKNANKSSKITYSTMVREMDRKLSYRKQIVHQLLTQHVDGIYSNSVTLKSGSLEIIQTGTVGKLGHSFLFAFYSNYGRTFSRF